MVAAANGCIQFTDLALTLVFKCNYRCPHCLVGDKLTSNEALSFEDAVAIVDSAAQLRTIRSIGFVGGEPFLVYPLMLKIACYVFEKYGRVALTASTNSYWAKSLQHARNKIAPLVEVGLHSLLLSWDDFHAKFGRIEQVANAIRACNEFGVEVTLQNIVIAESTRNTTIRRKLESLCDVSKVDWAESPAAPVGLGSQLPDDDHAFVHVDDLPYGHCTAGDILNVEADGNVKPCCGSGLMAAGLTMGNVHSRTIKEIVRKASVDPVFNSLVNYKGPKHLISLLRKEGREDLIPEMVTDVCDACFKITDDPEAMRVLRQALTGQQQRLLISRAASEDYRSTLSIEHSWDPQESIFSHLPNLKVDGVPRVKRDVFDAKRFRHEFVYRHEPALLDLDLFSQFPFLKTWSDPSYLRDRAGEEEVLVSRIGLSHGRTFDKMPFRAYLDRSMAEGYGLRGSVLYLAEQPLPGQLDHEAREVKGALAALSGQSGSTLAKNGTTCRADFMCFVGRFTYTDCHEHGGHEALMMQISGEKEVVLFEPTAQNYRALYADQGKFLNWSPVAMYRPNYARFPAFRDAEGVLVRVKAGEILYIPDGWFHAVASVGDNLTFTLTHFSPAAYMDMLAAPRWAEFEKAWASGDWKVKASIVWQVLGNPATLRSYCARRLQ